MDPFCHNTHQAQAHSSLRDQVVRDTMQGQCIAEVAATVRPVWRGVCQACLSVRPSVCGIFPEDGTPGRRTNADDYGVDDGLQRMAAGCGAAQAWWQREEIESDSHQPRDRKLHQRAGYKGRARPVAWPFRPMRLLHRVGRAHLPCHLDVGVGDPSCRPRSPRLARSSPASTVHAPFE